MVFFFLPNLRCHLCCTLCAARAHEHSRTHTCAHGQTITTPHPFLFASLLAVRVLVRCCVCASNVPRRLCSAARGSCTDRSSTTHSHTQPHTATRSHTQPHAATQPHTATHSHMLGVLCLCARTVAAADISAQTQRPTCAGNVHQLAVCALDPPNQCPGHVCR